MPTPDDLPKTSGVPDSDLGLRLIQVALSEVQMIQATAYAFAAISTGPPARRPVHAARFTRVHEYEALTVGGRV